MFTYRGPDLLLISRSFYKSYPGPALLLLLLLPLEPRLRGVVSVPLLLLCSFCYVTHPGPRLLTITKYVLQVLPRASPVAAAAVATAATGTTAARCSWRATAVAVAVADSVLPCPLRPVAGCPPHSGPGSSCPSYPSCPSPLKRQISISQTVVLIQYTGPQGYEAFIHTSKSYNLLHFNCHRVSLSFRSINYTHFYQKRRILRGK